MSSRMPALIVTAFIGAALPSARADVAALLPMCNACHGADGVGLLPGVPTLAGISALVIENAMIDYQSGARPCAGPQNPDRNPIDMCGPARLVPEQDLAAIAAHYAALDYRPKSQQTDAAQVAAGAELHARECEICHVDSGRDPSEDTSILAGQDLGYLRQALEDFASQARPTNAVKQAKFGRLDAEALEALAQFYAAQQ